MTSKNRLAFTEELERFRRASLHRRIGALETQLELLNGKYGAARAIKRIKLRKKIDRLKTELGQPMFVEVEGPSQTDG